MVLPQVKKLGVKSFLVIMRQGARIHNSISSQVASSLTLPCNLYCLYLKLLEFHFNYRHLAPNVSPSISSVEGCICDWDVLGPTVRQSRTLIFILWKLGSSKQIYSRWDMNKCNVSLSVVGRFNIACTCEGSALIGITLWCNTLKNAFVK